MKKTYLFFAVGLALLTFFACKDEVNAPIESIKFGWVPEDEAIREKYNIGDDGVFVGVGSTKVTSCIQEPISAKWSFVRYSTADSTVVVISPEGVLTGIGKGVTKVFAQIGSEEQGNLKTAELKVYVDTISVTMISIEPEALSFKDYSKSGILRDINGNDSLDEEGKGVIGTLVNTDTLFLNDYAVMNGVFEPIEASFTEMVWSTSNPNVFEISGDTIFAKGVGNAVLTGKLKYNHNDALTVSYSWVVTEAELERVAWATATHKMYSGTHEAVDDLLVFVPTYASDKSVSFNALNPDLFNVASGSVYCYSNVVGDTASIVVNAPQAVLEDGRSAICKFRVK